MDIPIRLYRQHQRLRYAPAVRELWPSRQAWGELSFTGSNMQTLHPKVRTLPNHNLRITLQGARFLLLFQPLCRFPQRFAF
jgi:hypothetical protein